MNLLQTPILRIACVQFRRSTARFAFAATALLTSWGALRASDGTTSSFSSGINAAQWTSVFVGLVGGLSMSAAAAADQLRMNTRSRRDVIASSARSRFAVQIVTLMGVLGWACILELAGIALSMMRVRASTGTVQSPGLLAVLTLGALVSSACIGIAAATFWRSRLAVLILPLLGYAAYFAVSRMEPDSMPSRFVLVADGSWDPFYVPDGARILLATATSVAASLGVMLLTDMSHGVRSKDSSCLVALLGCGGLATVAVVGSLLLATSRAPVPFLAHPSRPPGKAVCDPVGLTGKMCIWPQHRYRMATWTSGLRPVLDATAGIQGFPKDFYEVGLPEKAVPQGSHPLSLANTKPAESDIMAEALAIVPSEIVERCFDDGRVAAQLMTTILWARISGGSPQAASEDLTPPELKLLSAPALEQNRWFADVLRAARADCNLPDPGRVN